MRFHWKKHTLSFNPPGGTSRGVLNTKDSWFIIGTNSAFALPALGECSIITGLSPDPLEEIEQCLDHTCQWLNERGSKPDLSHFPAITFALETLEQDIAAKGTKVFSESAFTAGNKGILTNGLIWMGSPDGMKVQIKAKVDAGFMCIKLKIGAIAFEEELALLKWIRSEFGHSLELRVDANGAYSPTDALGKLKRLNEYNLHSIEQPIAPGQWDAMADLCRQSPVPIALDEELIGSSHQKERVLAHIRPQYIILKPSLTGGFAQCDEWMEAAKKHGIGWWLTSALESNIGLNAIAQYAHTKGTSMPQGLGTGGLYTNNFDSPLYLQGQFLFMHHHGKWDFSNLKP